MTTQQEALARNRVRPTHLLWVPGDKRALCGAYIDGQQYLWAPFAQVHIEGWGMVPCEACVAEAGRLTIPTSGGKTAEVPTPPERRRYPK